MEIRSAALDEFLERREILPKFIEMESALRFLELNPLGFSGQFQQFVKFGFDLGWSHRDCSFEI